MGENYMRNTKEANLPGNFGGKQKILKMLVNSLVQIDDLNAKNEELNSLIETQKRIIYILAHDLRNPLASIKNIIELKHSGILNKKDWSEVMDMMTGQLNTTIEMVENVMQWGQLHLKSGELQFEDFDMHQLVDRIFLSESINTAIKNNNLINDIEPGIIVNSDPWVMEFVLRNLVSNAGKFTEYGDITVSLQQTEKKTILTVKDTGIGMNVDLTNKLFDNKPNQSTVGTKNEKGSGLGLLLVKEFIDRLKGTITVESEINKGTIFKIEL
jgi:signal transduction histidine kinase